MANVADTAADPTLANSLVIPAGGKVELMSGQQSLESSTSAWGYLTNSDRPALRIAQSGYHGYPFLIWNHQGAPGAPSVQTDAGVMISIDNWTIGLFSVGPLVLGGSSIVRDCHISSTVEFAGGLFFQLCDCEHGAISITGIEASDNSGVMISDCRMHQGASGAYVTVPEGVGLIRGG